MPGPPAWDGRPLLGSQTPKPNASNLARSPEGQAQTGAGLDFATIASRPPAIIPAWTGCRPRQDRYS